VRESAREKEKEPWDQCRIINKLFGSHVQRMYKKNFYADYHHKEKIKRDGMKKYRLQETSLGGHEQVVLWRRLDFSYGH
jgi:hypothetical protein